jgi:hypothetical protein
MMRFSAIRSSGLKTSGKLLVAAIVLSSSSLLVLGQTVNRNVRQRTVQGIPETRFDPSGMPTSVDETFELNIDERRYSQESFAASTAVGTNDASDNLNLQIGVALTSGRIDVLLRNVHGTVRFRGTLGRILEIISNRQAASSQTRSAVSPVHSPVH